MNPRNCPKIKHMLSLIFHNNEGDVLIKRVVSSFSPVNTNGGEQRTQNKSELQERCIINTV